MTDTLKKTTDDSGLAALREGIRELDSVAVAFSGGVDSTFLLKVAHDELGDRCVAVTAASESMPGRELEEARAFCQKEGIRHIVFHSREMQDENYLSNPVNRCYYCKRGFLEDVLRVAAEEKVSAVAEGSNLDDLGDYRPGLKAVEELEIRSPLREAGLTKEEIRRYSRELGLSTWNKPSAACLASRIPYGERITSEKLRLVEQGERFLAEKGFRQFRVRLHGKLIRLEAAPEEMNRLLEPDLRKEIVARFKELGVTFVSLDLEGYRTGSLNESIRS